MDFLICYKHLGRRAQWMTAELDGRQHDARPAQDAERAEGLLVPELRYDNRQLLADHWFNAFLEDIRRGAVEGARREVRRARDAAARRKQWEEERQDRLDQR